MLIFAAETLYSVHPRKLICGTNILTGFYGTLTTAEFSPGPSGPRGLNAILQDLQDRDILAGFWLRTVTFLSFCLSYLLTGWHHSPERTILIVLLSAFFWITSFNIYIVMMSLFY